MPRAGSHACLSVCLNSPVEAGAVGPDAVQDDRELASNRHLRLPGADPLHQPDAPGLQGRPTLSSVQQDACRFEQVGAEQPIPPLRYELLPVWWTPRLGCFTGLGDGNGATTVRSGVQVRGDPAGQGRGVSVVQASRDLDVGENVLRRWIKEFGSDPGQAFSGQGQAKPEQQEIDRLRREVTKLKAERLDPLRGSSLRKAAAYFAKESM